MGNYKKTYTISYSDGTSIDLEGGIVSGYGDARLIIEDQDGDLWVFNWDHIKGIVEISGE